MRSAALEPLLRRLLPALRRVLPALRGARQTLQAIPPALRRSLEALRGADWSALYGPLLLVLAGAAAVLLMIGELTTQREVWILTHVQDSWTSGERHLYLLLLAGLAALPLAWGAAIGRSRPAATGLAAIAMLSVAVMLLADLPGLNDPGKTGTLYSDVDVKVGAGLVLQAIGTALMFLAAGALLRFTAHDRRAYERSSAPAVAASHAAQS